MLLRERREVRKQMSVRDSLLKMFFESSSSCDLGRTSSSVGIISPATGRPRENPSRRLERMTFIAVL